MKNLSESYLEKVQNVQSLKLVVVGQDPYPIGANGIAFCKSSFADLYDENCSGAYVLNALGYTLGYAIQTYINPVDMFMDLLDKGIAFVNMSGERLENTNIEYYQKFYDYNSAFLSKAEKIVVLGLTTSKAIFEELYASNFKVTEYLIHPSGKNREDERWTRYWTGTYLKDKYLEGKVMDDNLSYPVLDKASLMQYFDLNIPQHLLYSKGSVEKGIHGVEFVNGDYFASHYHLKTKLAKYPYQGKIANISPQELTRMASREPNFAQWPKVKYSADYYEIQKYSLSWIVNTLFK